LTCHLGAETCSSLCITNGVSQDAVLHDMLIVTTISVFFDAPNPRPYSFVTEATKSCKLATDCVTEYPSYGENATPDG
jgi:hypothetical protein